ncbi:flagella synthesis protein FlgN [Dyella psychrodurans]|uniref:Flagellar protein FlgN n=1 Tax=Dyella psychrodurans TaxID=1927960 RepID=A0A370X0R7_9GAMM|nr:flagellar export chaperone FlgN [Dyella psychrodurans]RDS81880.1 flagellar protein FlgN [Dyella psychrodurans]
MSPNLQAELGAALRTVLDEMSATTAQLITVLDEEREALTSADAKGLNRAGEAKQMLMRRLEQLDVERLHLSNTSTEAAQQADGAWQELLKSLATCRDKNLRNGALVGQRLTQVRRALSVLTGTDAQAGTYSQNGAVHGTHRSIPLAQA